MRALLMMFLLIGGCSDVERGPGTGGVDWSQYCNTTGPERAMRCGETWEPADTTECDQRATCIRWFIRADLYGDIPACLAGRDCGTSDDICFAAEGVGATGSAAATEYQSACLDRRSECTKMGESFSDDWCFANIATDAVIGQLSDCLASPCADVGVCFDAVGPSC